MLKKYKKAYVIGRFQPFHKGHLYLIKEALKVADKAVLGIGSANVSDRENPFTVDQRLVMLKSSIENADLQDFIEKIVTIDDVPDDRLWLKLAMEKVEGVDLIVGNNDWVNDIFEAAGYDVLRVPYYLRHIYQGKIIREKLRKANKLA
ncbi:nicotinamide-nucleotide adenylyltransferase [soil metagenome]